jgi:hypothetical protein
MRNGRYRGAVIEGDTERDRYFVAAPQSDVRKPLFGLCTGKLGRSPILWLTYGEAEPHRTSGGKAASMLLLFAL